MSREPPTFRESDLKRALRGNKRAGETAAAVKIEGGCIEIKLKNGGTVAVNNTDTANDDTNTNPWDEVDLK
jgi:hypothetical protein